MGTAAAEIAAAAAAVPVSYPMMTENYRDQIGIGGSVAVDAAAVVAAAVDTAGSGIHSCSHLSCPLGSAQTSWKAEMSLLESTVVVAAAAAAD